MAEALCWFCRRCVGETQSDISDCTLTSCERLPAMTVQSTDPTDDEDPVRDTLLLLNEAISLGRRDGMAGQHLGAMCSARDMISELNTSLTKCKEAIGVIRNTRVYQDDKLEYGISVGLIGAIHNASVAAGYTKPDLQPVAHSNQDTREQATMPLPLDYLIKAIPDGWFLDALGEDVTPVNCIGDKHDPMGTFHAALQYRNGGGSLTHGKGATPAEALQSAIRKVMSRLV